MHSCCAALESLGFGNSMPCGWFGVLTTYCAGMRRLWKIGMWEVVTAHRAGLPDMRSCVFASVKLSFHMQILVMREDDGWAPNQAAVWCMLVLMLSADAHRKQS